jgi:hypothetical protein
MTTPVTTRLCAVCVAASAVTASVDASAHYYGVIETPTITNGDASDGEFTFIKTDVLQCTCNLFEHRFVDHEMWYETDPSADDWVEVGFLDGTTDSDLTCVSDLSFWADNRPAGGGFNQHFFEYSWTIGDWYAMQIASDGSCAWSVELGGIDLGTSTANCPSANRLLIAGIEVTNQDTGSVRGFLEGWEEQNSSEIWHDGWDGVSPPSNGPSSNNPPNIKFSTEFGPSSTNTEETHNEPW